MIAYNEVADYILMNLRKNDIICGNGKISCNEVEILQICDFG